jgi:polysaccharide export outer membrane protein
MRLGTLLSSALRLTAALSCAVLLAACGTSSIAPEPGASVSALGADPDAAGSIRPAAARIGQSEEPAEPVRKAAAKAASSFTAAAIPGNTGYKIGPQDVVEINVFQVADLSRTAQVNENGSIGLPLIGDVPAAGRTAQELEREIAGRLTKYLQKPQVAVMMKEYNAQRITLEGAVKKPGVYPLRNRTTLLQTIARAEGFSDIADTSVVVFRQTTRGQAAARFDVAAIRAGTAEDPTLQSGDVVVVGASTMKETMQSVMKFLPLVSVFALL